MYPDYARYEYLTGKRTDSETDAEGKKYLGKDIYEMAALDLLKDEIVSEQLTRWDQAKAASVSNLVLRRFTEVDEHESRTIEDIKENEPEYFNRVTSTLKRAELDFGS